MEKEKVAVKKVYQTEINNAIWSVCDVFRGSMDASSYKNYILVFLFLKYISDVWKETYEAYAKLYNNDVERIMRKMGRERFILNSDCTFDHIVKNMNKSNLGDIINKVFEKIEEQNKNKLEGVFRGVNFNDENALGETKERNYRLQELIKVFQKPQLDFSPSRIGSEDIIGSAYMFLIERFASDAGKKGGEFYTPHEISSLLAKLVKPKAGERICDPACGSGSLLISVAEEVPFKKEAHVRDCSLYGQESNGGTWALSRMNMFLHGMDSADIEWGDTIRNPKLIEGGSLLKFDVVVANPPFSLDKWGHEYAENDPYGRFKRGIPPRSKGDFAFILHMIETAAEKTGRVGVIVPHGVLFRGGQENVIRKKLIEENLLDAVIGLPANLFYGTGIPAAILIFNKGKKNDDVLFIDASKDYEAGKKQNKIRDEHINKIIDAFKKREDVPKYAHVAKLSEISENDFNLNIPRYVDTFEEEKIIDIAATQKEIKRLEKELQNVQFEMEDYLKELGIN